MIIRPSQLASYLACEKQGVRALGTVDGIAQGTIRLRERDQHVATWIGKCVHARLAGDIEPAVPELLVYDATTPTMNRAKVQIMRMTQALQASLSELGWTPLAREVQVGPINWGHWPHNVHLQGTADLLAVDADGKGVLVDVKTSKEIVKAWLQLGCYALAYEHVDCGIPGAPRFVDRVAVAHCPRPQTLLDEPKAEIYSLYTHEIRNDTWHALNRVVANLHNPEAAPAAPGPGCRYCTHPECRVRIRDYQP